MSPVASSAMSTIHQVPSIPSVKSLVKPRPKYPIMKRSTPRKPEKMAESSVVRKWCPL